jgi:hypothetical protein
MANENKNTGPNLQGQNLDQKALRESLKNLIEDQGDYNNLLKNAISDLKRMDTAYSKIEARLASLNKDSINVKQVNQELLRLRQKEFLESKKLTDLRQNETAKAALELAKQNTEQLMKDAELLGVQEDYEENMLKYLKESGNIEALALYAAEKQLEIAKAQTKEGEEALKTEKQVSRQLGISGNLMKIFAEKIGVGEEAYSAMTIKARNLVEEQKKMTAAGKIFSKVIGGFQVAFAGAGSIFKSAFSSLLDPAAILGGVGLLIKGLKAALDFILEIQDKTVKFARAMNLSTQEARRIKMEFADLSISSGDLFITSQKMVESQMEFVDALGVTNRLTNEQLATNIKLKDITGLDLETRQGIVEASTITGQSSQNITKSVLAQVTGLKQATGVSFQYQRILKEASNLGGYLGLSFAKYPAQLTKSLLTVKAMGMELKEVDSLADSFLDFESSISKEFEAQLLTGKEINLTKAREAFLNNDLATAAGEITSQVGSAADFLKLNRIQAESLASAFGMSRDQMGEMLKRQEMLSKLGAKDTDNAQKQLQLGLQRYKTQEALAAAVGEEAYQSLVNASAQEKIGAFMEKIKQSIADFVEKSGIIEKLEGFFDYLSKPENVRAVIIKIRDIFAQVVDIVATIASGVVGVLDFFGAISDEKADSIQSFLEGTGDKIRSMGGDFGGVTVTEKSAKNETIGTATPATPDNKMAMPASPQVYVMVTVDPVTGKTVEKVVTQDYFEKHFGKQG